MAMAKADLGWEHVLEHRVSVVLGEAGSGKSRELEFCCDRLRRDGANAFVVDIARLANDGLPDAVLQKYRPSFETWAHGDEAAQFFLDSLDESKLQRASLERAFAKLRTGLKTAVERASLVLSCRASDWSIAADGPVASGFLPDVEAKIFELAPLDEARVRSLATHAGVRDPDSFMTAVDTASAAIFLGRPQYVVWVAQVWRDRGALGDLTELVASDVRNKLTEDSERAVELGEACARVGAEQAAIGLALSAQRELQVASSVAGGLRVSAVLPDWSDAERGALFRRGLFDLGTYGRIRMHHRTVQEFLAAQWLAERLRVAGGYAGLSRTQVRALLMPTVDGEPVVPVHLQAVAAWLAQQDDELRRRLVKAAPEVLLSEGDPSRLVVSERCEVLRAFARRSGAADRWIPSPGHDNLRRFASDGLGETLDELLRRAECPAQVKDDLLWIAAYARADECYDVALENALDPDCTWFVRRAAIAVLAATDQERAVPELLALSTSDLGWTATTCAAMVEHFARALSTDDVLGMVRAVRRIERGSLTALELAIAHELRRAWGQCSRVALAERLLHSDDQPQRVSEDGGHVGSLEAHIGGELVAGLLADCIDSDWPEGLVKLLARVRQDDLEVGNLVHHSIRETFREHASLRRVYFWHRVEEIAAETGEYPSRRYDVLFHGNDFFTLGADDIEWLSKEVRRGEDSRAHLLVFNILVALPYADDAQREHVLSEASQGLPTLEQRLVEVRKNTARQRQREQQFNEERAAEHARRRAGTLAALTERTEDLRNGDPQLLLPALTLGSGRLRPIDVNELYEALGTDLAEATLAGVDRAWRNHTPDLRAEKGGIHSSRATTIGLLGIDVAARVGQLAARTAADAERLLVYAACSANRWPEWADAIVERHHVLACDVLGAELRHEFGAASTDTPPLLSRLQWRGGAFSNALGPVLVRVLNDAQPGSPGALQAALDAVIHAGVEDEIVETAESRARSLSLDAPDFEPWWTFLLDVDHDRARRTLADALTTVDEAAHPGLLASILVRLANRADHPAPVRPRLRANARALEWFVPLMLTHTSLTTTLPAIERFHDRESLPHARAWLVEALCGGDSEDALAAMRKLQDDPRLTEHRSRILRNIDRLRRSTGPCAPMDEAQVATFIERGIREIRGPNDLYACVLDTLDDVRAFVEEDDFRYPELFAKADERSLQRWLAAELSRRSLGRFAVTREEEIAEQKRTDLRIHAPGATGSACITIEVKFADRWPDLNGPLRDQLVGLYLREEGCNHGIYLVANRIRERRDLAARPPRDPRLDELSTLAEQLAAESPGVERLDVVWMDLYVGPGESKGRRRSRGRQPKVVPLQRGSG